MLTLNSSHAWALTFALLFSLFVHFSLTGFAKKLQTYLIIFITFPVVLMALTLFIPQDLLQFTSYFLLATGFAFSIYNLPQRLRKLSLLYSKMDKKEKWIALGTIIYLFSLFMRATVFADSGSLQDALVYHLEGPKEWALYLNGAKFNPNNPTSFTTSYYDYYYYFLILLIKPLFIQFAQLPSTQYEFLSYTMLLTAQIFSGIIAFIYIPVLALRFTSSLGTYKYLAIFFIFGFNLITWSWVLPKNDPYSFLCFLLGAELILKNYIVKENNNNAFFLFLASLIIGIGTASKMTNSYVVIFSVLFFCSFYFTQIKSYFKEIGIIKTAFIIIISLGLGTSVFLIRNILYTGNPFYPIAKFGFPNIYLSDYAYRPALYSDPTDWAGALIKIKTHLLQQPPLLFLLILALFTRARAFSLFYISMVIYMSKQTGVMFRFRMTTIFLLLALILFIQIVHYISVQKNFRIKKVCTVLLIFIILAFSRIQIENLIKYPLKIYPQTTGELIKYKVDYWDILLKTNLEHHKEAKYVFAPKLEIFPYFSRFPTISLSDSVTKYRYDYYKNLLNQ